MLSQFELDNQPAKSLVGEEIRVRGTVQGVGFRPTVYRLAKECGLRGEVLNDEQGVLIKVIGTPISLDTFVQRLQTESPCLAKINEIIRCPYIETDDFIDFVIVQSNKSTIRTEITPDAATCPTCQDEIFDSSSRWYRYPFTNCTHCGPRLSIIKHLPYDRANTSMAGFKMCPDCAKEYQNPANRRFHAQPIACKVCGPHVWLEKAGKQRWKPLKGSAVPSSRGILSAFAHGGLPPSDSALFSSRETLSAVVPWGNHPFGFNIGSVPLRLSATRGLSSVCSSRGTLSAVAHGGNTRPRQFL